MADKHGNNIIDNLTSRLNIANEEYFIMAKETKKPVISDIMNSERSGARIISVAVPILDKSQNFIGIIQSNVVVKALENNIGTVKIAESGFAYLLSSSGNIIFHREWQRIGKNYTEFANSKNKLNAFEEGVFVNDSGFMQYSEDDGLKMVGTYATVPTTGWKIIVTAPSDEIYKNANTSNLISIILIISATVIVVVISLFTANRIAKPVKIAADHLNILAKADFTKDLPDGFINRKDETGVLMKSVNVMSKSIRTVINDVISEASNVKENIIISSENLTELSDRISEVSSTTEDMSAMAQQTAAATEQMNATSVDIENAVRSIAQKAQNGSVVVSKISERALDLKESAAVSRSTTNDIRNAIDSEMKSALEWCSRRVAKESFAGGWEFPGGKIEAGEGPKECLARELKEELALEVDVGDFITLVEHDYKDISISLAAYYCNILKGQIKVSVHDSYKWVKISDLLTYDLLPADIPIAKKLIKTRGM